MAENEQISFSSTELDFHSKEAINMLRASVQMAGQSNRVFGVTSSVENEGKSSLSFRLAQSLSGLEGKRVVLVDCDIRNSKAKKRLKIVQKIVGLSELLCGMCSMEDVITHTQNPQLDIVFSGKYAPNPSELLSADAFGKFILWLKERYDFVLMDMPPVNMVVDATIIAPKCDTNIMIVECGVTEKRELYHAVDLLRRADAKLLGIVLNKVNSKKNRYGKYGHYGKYGKYGKYGQNVKFGKYAYRKYKKYNYDEDGEKKA